MDQYNWLLRLEKGELFADTLSNYVTDQNIRGAWLQGLGAAMWAEVGYYDLDQKAYQWKRLEGPLEITGLQGNVAWQGDKPVLHVHATFSDKSMLAFGGHLKDMEIAGTCEVFLHRWYGDELSRSLDDTTGLNLLDL